MELWKPISGYEGIYEISTCGTVRRTDGKYGGNITPYLTNSGYLQVFLRRPREKRIHKHIHRLVAEAFIPNKENVMVVNHKDGCKTNNNVQNLEWVTPSQNQMHSTYTLNNNMGFGKTRVKCVETQKIYPSISEAERDIGVSGIYRCLHDIQNTCGGYHWKKI